MPHRTLSYDSPIIEEDYLGSVDGTNNDPSSYFDSHHHTASTTSTSLPSSYQSSSNIHHAGICPCVTTDKTPIGNFRRRQSQQSKLAKQAMASSGSIEELRRRSGSLNNNSNSSNNTDDVSSTPTPNDRDRDVDQLRFQLDSTLQSNGPSHNATDMSTLDHPEGRPLPQRATTSQPRGSAMAGALNGQIPQPDLSSASRAMNDTPTTTAPSSPRMYGNTQQHSPRLSTSSSSSTGYQTPANLHLSPPVRQNSGTNTPRVRATTLDVPGLTKSKVSPDGRIAQRDVGAKLVIVMVGLPARGKSYITKKLARYLNWLQHDTRIFNVGERRRIVAGGPNALEKTKSQQSQQAEQDGHRPSMAAVAHQDMAQPDAQQQQKQDPAHAVASIMLNGEKTEAPGTPPTAQSTNDGQGEALRRSSTHNSSSEGPEDTTDPDLKKLEEQFPELTKASTPVDEEGREDPDAMDQNASFFDPNNKRAALIREQVALETLDELLEYIINQNGSVGILDATNSTLERRKMMMKHIRSRAGPELNVLFLESLCLDQDLLEANMKLKLNGPDYRDKDPDEALADFKKRIDAYEGAYVPLGEYEEKNNMPFIQMIDVGRKIISHQIRGFLSAQANYYLLNFNLAPRQIWITRHGLSQDNVSGKIGGDSDLAPEGHRYAVSLARFMEQKRREWDDHQMDKLANSHFPPQAGDATPPNPYFAPSSPRATRSQPPRDPWASSAPSPSTSGAHTPTSQPEIEPKAFCVWTSMLKRSIQTAAYFNDEEYDTKQMRMLDELNAGIMEGLTYNCISTQYPTEFAHRKADKLHYRYPGPGGEGYLDIINRLRPVIVELERMTDHVLLVGHRSVARVLLAYFRGLPREDVADLDVPLGMLYCLEPKPYGVDFRAYKWDKRSEWFHEVPDFQLKRAQDDMQ